VDEVIDDEAVLGNLLGLLDQEEEHGRRHSGTDRHVGPPGSDEDAGDEESLEFEAWTDFVLVVDGFVELDEKPIVRSNGCKTAV
jgi:hypothetical protein